MKKYTPYLQITCKHNYFTNGIFRHSQITPTAETNSTLKNLDIRLKVNEDGITLYSSDSTPSLLNGDQSKTQFLFSYDILDHLFFSYSDLPNYNPQTQVFYFEPKNSEGKTISLHKSDYVGMEDSKERTEIKGIGNNTTGLISLEMDLNRILNKEPIELQQYEIRFNSRKVIWRYYIVPNNSVENPELEITSNNALHTFGEAKLTPISNDTKAYEIISDKPIEFKERHSTEFTLKYKNPTEGEIILPNASPNTLSKGDGNELLADIYIYL